MRRRDTLISIAGAAVIGFLIGKRLSKEASSRIIDAIPVSKVQRMNYKDVDAIEKISRYIKCNIDASERENCIIVCVGTNKVKGDDLAPMTGSALKNLKGFNIPVYGTLNSPITATNIREVIEKIRMKHPSSKIIAVDAGLGDENIVGNIEIGCETLKPGLANVFLKEALPQFGDISILGFVGLEHKYCGMDMEKQKIAPKFVSDMAEVICKGILEAFRNL